MLASAVGPEGHIYMSDLPYTAERSQAPSEAFVAATHDAFVVAALICSIGIATSLVRGGGREQVAREPVRALN
jgi:hypothetical protein